MRALYAILALIASSGIASAQSYPQRVTVDPSSAALGTKPGVMVPLGTCTLSVSNTATLLSTCSGGIPTGATIAVITVESNGVRWRDDGTAPTASAGIPLNLSNQLTYSASLNALEFIAQTGTATIDVWFGR